MPLQTAGVQLVNKMIQYFADEMLLKMINLF